MNILLCDDEEHSLNRLKNAVSEVCPGSEIYAFTDPLTALKETSWIKPDIAFLDIEMPEMNGIVLGKSMKELFPHTRLIFCTGYSEYALDAFGIHASGYVLKPYRIENIKREIEELPDSYRPKTGRVRIQTFGTFNVFADDRLVTFSRSKSKEILAILTDRVGGEVTADALANLLWRDDKSQRAKLKQLYVFVGDLKKDLEEFNISEILIKTKTGYALNAENIDCDYFRVLKGDAAMLNRYFGEYMSQYTWAEFTNAYLKTKK